MSEVATLTALVHGKQTAVSFRHLSSLLNVSTRKAQTLLCDFVTSDPTVTALWCVTQPHPKTGVLRTSLTTTPPADVKKQIWAVGPNTAANVSSKQAVWLTPDAVRYRNLVTQPSHIQNELRDGRWNRITSRTSTWDTKLDPRLGGDARLATDPANPPSSKVSSSSLLASVKAKAKGKKAKSKGFMGGAFKSSSGGSASLFASKPLGAGAVRKMQNFSPRKDNQKKQDVTKAKSEPESLTHEETGEKSNSEARKNRKRRTSSKKTRKVVDDDSDSERRALLEDAEAEENEEEECMRKFEDEDAEKERADAEREELEKELMELNRTEAEEDPESPELKELKDTNDANHEALSPVPGPEELRDSPDTGKRSFWQTFGDGQNDTKRVRKEIEETVEENGYFVTRRVVKIFDEHGNEVKDSEPDKSLPEAKQTAKGMLNEERAAKHPQSKSPQSTKETFLTSSVKKEKMKESKRSLSKVGATTKKTPKKRIKGNIMSYFGKKT